MTSTHLVLDHTILYAAPSSVAVCLDQVVLVACTRHSTILSSKVPVVVVVVQDREATIRKRRPVHAGILSVRARGQGFQVQAAAEATIRSEAVVAAMEAEASVAVVSSEKSAVPRKKCIVRGQ